MVSNIAKGTHRRAIGTFPNRSAAERALHELRNSGFPMDRVSVIARDSDHRERIAGTEVRDRTDNKADDGAKVGALSGGALGGLTGLLVGLGALAIPGIGPIMLAGAAATTLATTAAGGAIGAAAGGLLGGLIGLGIPEERARVYQDRVSAGEYLVMVDGTDAEIAQAKRILDHGGIQEWGVYDIPHASQQSVVSSARTPDRVSDRGVDQQAATSNVEDVKLYEERLIVDKARVKTGEVEVSKHVEVETAHTAVPLEKERVVIERTPVNNATPVNPANAFHESEAVRMDVYEEVPDVHKEAFVREEVNLRKEVIQENVQTEETLRREELDIDAQGRPIVENRPNSIRDDRR